MFRRLRWLVLMLSMAAVVVAAVPTAKASPLVPPIPIDKSSPFGVVGNLAITVRNDEQSTMVALMREAGVQWHREDFSWERLQPRRDGRFIWSGDDKAFLNFDRTVATVSASRIQILGLLGYNPAWFKGKNPQLDAWLPDWQRYVAAVVGRYGRQRGEIKVWEVWNEPNLAFYGYENGLYTIADYARLLRVTYSTIKSVDPDARIVLGGLANVWSEAPPHFYDAWDYLQVLADAGAWSSFDILNLHAYRPGAPEGRFQRRDRQIDLGDEMATLDGMMATYGPKPVWITEISWGAYTGPYGVTAEEQAYYLVRFYALALSYPNVEKLFWYNFRDNMAVERPYNQPIYDNKNPDWNMGLLRRTYPLRLADPALRKPAFVAFRTLVDQLGGLEQTEQIARGDRADLPQVYWLRYGAPERGAQLLWHLGSQPLEVTATCACIEARVRTWNGMLDRIIHTDTGSFSVSIPPGGEPIYVEYGPDRAPGTDRFAETGHTLGGVFRDYWQRHGGLAQFGYPITGELIEPDPQNGSARTVQYFERNRFEYFPENQGTPYEVQLGRLGADQLRRLGLRWQDTPASTDARGCRRFVQTRRQLCPPFRAYWEQHGGLSMYGLPLTDAFYDNGRLVQYFERNRFEYHPEQRGTPYEVLLGLLGVELYTVRPMPPGQ